VRMGDDDDATWLQPMLEGYFTAEFAEGFEKGRRGMASRLLFCRVQGPEPVEGRAAGVPIRHGHIFPR
jgi:hypothetical protein